MSYALDLFLDPARGHLRGDARLSVAVTPKTVIELFLHRDFDVLSVEVDGRPVSFRWAEDGQTLPYIEVARALEVAADPALTGIREVRVQYAGKLGSVISDVNRIEPHLVELAIYAAYHPLVAGGGSFPARLRVSLPANFTVVSRGNRLGVAMQDGRRIETWEAAIPGPDIPLVASDLLRVEHARSGGVDVAVYYRDLDPIAAKAALQQAVESLEYLTKEFGATAADALRLVFSPRDGWAYSRVGLIVQSERRHMQRAEGVTEEAPPDQNVHNIAHEISHFWWRIADPQGVDDWINEALAEFSAAKDSGRRSPALHRHWAGHYLRSLRERAPPVGILATDPDSPYRYVNWYERGALFFICLEARHGDQWLQARLVELLELGSHRALATRDVVQVLERGGADRGEVLQWLEEPGLELAERCVSALPMRRL